jgi:hypothetical protein
MPIALIEEVVLHAEMPFMTIVAPIWHLIMLMNVFSGASPIFFGTYLAWRLAVPRLKWLVKTITDFHDPILEDTSATA